MGVKNGLFRLSCHTMSSMITRTADTLVPPRSKPHTVEQTAELSAQIIIPHPYLTQASLLVFDRHVLSSSTLVLSPQEIGDLLVFGLLNGRLVSKR